MTQTEIFPRFDGGQGCFQSLFKILGVGWGVPLWWGWSAFLAEPEYEVDAVAVGVRVGGVLGDQLVAERAPQVAVPALAVHVPFDFHRHLEVTAGNPYVGAVVVGVVAFGLGVDPLGELVSQGRKQGVAAHVLVPRSRGAPGRIYIPVLTPAVGIAALDLQGERHTSNSALCRRLGSSG